MLPIGETMSSAVRGPPWIGIVANRNSGIGRGRQQVARLASCALAGWPERPKSRGRPRIEPRSSKRAGRDPACRCLVAVGGDGTVSALLNERPSVPVSVFPAGTENLVAQQFGLRRNAAALAKTITEGHPRRVDVGSAMGRRFLLMVGFGFDGDVVTRHHNARLSHSGRIRPTTRLAYVDPVLRSSFSYRFPQITVRIENEGVPEDPDRNDGILVQRAPVCPGPSVRPGRAGRRRLARLADLSRSGAVQGALLPLEGLSRHASRAAERLPSPRQVGDRDLGRHAYRFRSTATLGAFCLRGGDRRRLSQVPRSAHEPEDDARSALEALARFQPPCGQSRSFPRPPWCMPPGDVGQARIKLRSQETAVRDKIRSEYAHSTVRRLADPLRRTRRCHWPVFFRIPGGEGWPLPTL